MTEKKPFWMKDYKWRVTYQPEGTAPPRFQEVFRTKKQAKDWAKTCEKNGASNVKVKPWRES